MKCLQVIEGFWDDKKCTELRQEIGKVVESIDLTASRSIFTTSNNMEGTQLLLVLRESVCVCVCE